jgi:hypothetical protein
MGCVGAVPFVSGLRTGFQVKDCKLHHFGEDVAIEGYLRDPYLD